MKVNFLYVFALIAVVVLALGSVVAAPLFVGQPVPPMPVTQQSFFETQSVTTVVPTSATDTAVPTHTRMTTQTSTPTPTATFTQTQIPSATRTASPTFTPTVTMPPEGSFTLMHSYEEPMYGLGSFRVDAYREGVWTLISYQFHVTCKITPLGFNADGDVVFKVNQTTITAVPGTLFDMFILPEGVSPSTDSIWEKAPSIMYDPQYNLPLGKFGVVSYPLSTMFIMVSSDGRVYLNSMSKLSQKGDYFCSYIDGLPDSARRWGVGGYPVHDPLNQGCPGYSFVTD